MNLIMFLLKLPWFPVQGFVKLATVIKEEADQEMANPATIRRTISLSREPRTVAMPCMTGGTMATC